MLPVTGERTVPDLPDENYWFRRHVAAYDHAAGRVAGTVLDAGCGEGYGLAILHAAGARGVIGVDVDPSTADHARARYGHDGVAEVDVVEADLGDLPLVDDTLDAILCLQVVEHLEDPGEALAELVRVGRPGADLVVSTPNRATFTPDGSPRNPFHVREYDLGELRELVASAGAVVEEVVGVHHGAALQRRLDELAGPDPVATLADPSAWSPALREVVHAVRADDFDLLADDEGAVESSLDLVVWARVP